MNKQILKIKQNFVLCLVMLSLLALSCNRADMEEGHISESGFLVTLTDDVRVESRSTPVELEDPLNTDFDLKIIRSSTGETVYDGKFKEDLIQASAGFYQVTASFGTNPVLDVDAPYYEGTVTEVEVRKDTPAQVLVPCKVANALLSVVYGESIAKVYDSYYVTVAVGEESREIRDNESAYFRAGSVVNVWFHGTPKGESEERTFELLHEGLTVPLEAGEHAILNLSIEAGVSVSVEKVEVKTTTVSETIPVEYMPKPKLEAEGFSNNELTFAETEKKAASVHLKLASPLQELKMRFHFEDAQFASLNDQDYLLSKDKAALENALGITLPDVNATDATIDFSNLIAKMQTNAGATTRNVIELDAQANNRWSSDKETDASSRKLTLNCNKPVFSVVVSSGNIWTKEFKIDGCNVQIGDFETISSRVQYQYRKKGDVDWINCDPSRLVKFDMCPADKEYEVRAVYREGIEAEPVTIQLETPQQLPNSGMEEWHAESLGTFAGIPNFWNKYEFYDFLPYNTGEMDIWWTTNNERSRDYSVSRVHVTSSPCVSYSESVKHGGNRAALIYTSGHGGKYASTSNTLYEEGAFAGCLFVGTYSWSSGTENMNLGHTFEARPTSVRFWYNYIPKNSDSFKVYVELKNGEEIIGTGTFIPSALSAESGWQEGIVEVEYVDSPKSATSICVQFLSTDKTSFSESDFDKNKSITFPVMESWNAHIGSMLYIDDISLVYDK
ncbi:DUF4493 domain-containing protein [Phocaeicola coprophilus]|uniref:DUF4493 domain-containing protein n=1 Tax=Phocaeicola coprophilus TaxID=387090 RepID=UPI00266B834C|nr:DUF4493 domain-containing protein [Phocaeicola coprophilus]